MIDGAYSVLGDAQSDVEYCQGRVHPPAKDINHVIPKTLNKMLWKIIARGVLAQIFFSV